jgi:endonuclease YncB( thermonuclease family)
VAQRDTRPSVRRRGLPVGFGLIGAVALILASAAGCGGEASAREATAIDPPEVEAVPAEIAPAETAPAETAPPVPSAAEAKTQLVSVARVIDGDTIELRNGDRVRLVQIDSPEVGEECFADEATEVLSAILPVGTKVRLAADRRLDDVDRYERLLRYVFKGKKNVNLTLVERGAASVWFYDGDTGRYAHRLLKAVKRAKADNRGLWGACPGTKLDPTRAVETNPAEPASETTMPPESPPPPEAASTCHPSYEGACLDPGVSDYDCAGGEGNGPGYTGPVTVVGPDEYDLDSNQDGAGCENS